MAIGKKIGNAVMRSLKVIGVRADDITDMVNEFGIDQTIGEEIEKLQQKNNVNEIVLLGRVVNEKLIFQAVEFEGDKNFEKGFEINFFGIKKNSFSISDIVIELVNLIFETHSNKNKKKKKK